MTPSGRANTREGRPAITSTVRQDLYVGANDLDLVLKDVRPAGKHWQGYVRDALVPDRPEDFFHGDPVACKEKIARYAAMRDHYLANHPEHNPAQPYYGPPAISVTPMPPGMPSPPGPPPPGPPIIKGLGTDPPLVEIIEIPSNGQEDYDAGFNDGLAQGMALAPAAAPTLVGPSPNYTKLHQEFKEAVAENDRLQADIQRLKTSMASGDIAYANLRDSNTQLLAQIDGLVVELDNARAKLNSANDATVTLADRQWRINKILQEKP